MTSLPSIIEAGFEQRQQLTPDNVPSTLQEALAETLLQLDSGKLRAAEKTPQGWMTHQWIKKAILLIFKTQKNQTLEAGYTRFYDKIPLKFTHYEDSAFAESGIRVVPSACVRLGAYIAPNTILMPSYVNIGAYIDSGTLVDTWATVGSCAQIGKNVHLSGGVGIGGVLEPLQTNPTIIEDNCFIGARSEIVEGVIVEQDAVISMGVYISPSTPIYHRDTKEIIYGRVPAGSVVIPGTLPAKDGSYGRYCAIIMKQVDAKTRSKTALNDLLREINHESTLPS